MTIKGDGFKKYYTPEGITIIWTFFLIIAAVAILYDFSQDWLDDNTLDWGLFARTFLWFVGGVMFRTYLEFLCIIFSIHDRLIEMNEQIRHLRIDFSALRRIPKPPIKR